MMMELASPPTILVVDDEASLRLFLGEELTEEGYRVYTAADGREALVLLKQQPVDLAIVDLQMPHLNGLELMAAIETLADPPELIMLTAHASLQTSIEAMRRGSSDFLLKPYQMEELLRGIERAMQRRQRKLKQKLAARLLAESLGVSAEPEPQNVADTSPPTAPDNLPPSGLSLDLDAMTVTKDGQLLTLTPTEFRLLVVMMKRQDHLYTFQELAEVIYGQHVEPMQARDLLKSQLGRLRQKLGQTPAGVDYIANVRGVGYKFVGEAL
jgi:two-component system, OmpR family, KDP operon response regulator KdpE